MIKINFLGTNGWYDTATGNTICVLIETTKEYIVLDAGNGIYKIDQYIKENKPIHLFISHFHLDHIEGLHILAKFHFPQGINIYIQKGGRKLLNTIMRQPFTLALKDLSMPTRVIELNRKNDFPIFLEECQVLYHIARCIGFRFNLEGKIVTYLPDTGTCPNAYKLAKKADFLIAESAFKPGQNSDDWPHLNPETAAIIAKEAEAKKLALVHFDAEVYQTIKERETAGKKAQKIFLQTLIARDNQQVFV